jgi:NAD(P)H-dependent FMN reductase
METKPLILIGSARHDSDTKKLAHVLFPAGSVKIVDLLDYIIYPYSYEGLYPADDEFSEVCEIIRQHEKVVFCTPVYWYAMSGLMKIFFDRLTDLVTIQKKTGRSMAGKKLIWLQSEPKKPYRPVLKSLLSLRLPILTWLTEGATTAAQKKCWLTMKVEPVF